MTLVRFKCAHCHRSALKRPCDIARAKAAGLNVYCDRVCAGFGRRKNKPDAEKKAEKAAYDAIYRARNLTKIKTGKRAHYLKTYDPLNAAKERKVRMPRHVEYCRQPKYKAYKQNYDQTYRAKKIYGPFAEAFLTLTQVNREVNTRMTDYEVRIANDTCGKTQKRKRDAAANR